MHVVKIDPEYGFYVEGGLKTLTMTVKDEAGIGVSGDVLFDVSHVSNAHSTVVFSLNENLKPALASSLSIGSLSYVLFQTENGVCTLHASAVRLVASNVIYAGVAPGSIKINITGDVAGSCSHFGEVSTRTMRVDQIHGFTSDGDDGVSVFNIRNMSRGGPGGVVQIGSRGSSCRIFDVECLDSDGVVRTSITSTGITNVGGFKCKDESGNTVCEIDGAGNVSATSFASLSDHRSKQNVIRLHNSWCLNQLMKLRCYSYEFKNEPTHTHYGMMANQVREHLPNITRKLHRASGGTMVVVDSVVYSEIIPLLVSAMQWVCAVVVLLISITLLLCFKVFVIGPAC